MQLRFFFLALSLFAAAVLSPPATCAYAQSLSKGTSAARLPKSQEVQNFSARILDKVVPGHTTKAEVEALLGKPWRDTALDDETIPYPGDPSRDIWEFRGRDSHGAYRVHIEFDQHNVTTLIAKIPDKTGQATARVPEQSGASQ
jgi:outer membrane protein assembly factor BamE (lipoprotein component of BamABCDE complex)